MLLAAMRDPVHQGLWWLEGRDFELVMGEAVCNWLRWRPLLEPKADAPGRSSQAWSVILGKAEFWLKHQPEGGITVAREAFAALKTAEPLIAAWPKAGGNGSDESVRAQPWDDSLRRRAVDSPDRVKWKSGTL